MIAKYATQAFNDGPFLVVITAEEEDLPIRGNLISSGDPAFDEACERETAARLNNGDWTAWFFLRVEVSFLVEGEGLKSVQNLGCCSCEGDVDLKEIADTHGLIHEAKKDLLELLRKYRDRLNEIL